MAPGGLMMMLLAPVGGRLTAARGPKVTLFAGTLVIALGYGSTGLSVGQRVFGLMDWYRDGALAEYAAVEARNLAPLPGDVNE